ncbi:hypothetical protein LX32DRAFT_357451 [Colletotrichum zoysiae]|uniref:Uncharacterized protein n=1 Tax=Colletotrichum zoysiae TaxID=1216348 RepID=A0AAD9HHT0_9PEZI|nr:hypothetical protein LX32DRAFT_357451 [Colletotrichum zoysiae]
MLPLSSYRYLVKEGKGRKGKKDSMEGRRLALLTQPQSRDYCKPTAPCFGLSCFGGCALVHVARSRHWHPHLHSFIGSESVRGRRAVFDVPNGPVYYMYAVPCTRSMYEYIRMLVAPTTSHFGLSLGGLGKGTSLCASKYKYLFNPNTRRGTLVFQNRVGLKQINLLASPPSRR